MVELKFSEIQKVMEMMDDYMNLTVSWNPRVCGITYDPQRDYEFEFAIKEAGSYSLYVKNWEIYNSNAEKCIDVMRKAYDDCPDMMAAIDRFEEKWKVYKK